MTRLKPLLGRVGRILVFAALVLVWLPASGGAKEAGQRRTPPPLDPLARARAFYNQQRYDEAISAAVEARRSAAWADAAALVQARALLERYRITSLSEDLLEARAALGQVSAAVLSERDRLELLVGQGLALYLDGCLSGCYGGAAELFERALSAAAGLGESSRDDLFEWWAGSLDRQAQFGLDADRKPIYQRLLDGVTARMARAPASAVVWYWLAVSSHGVGDLERAWSVSVAAYAAAGSLGPAGRDLRRDIDRFVLLVLLPDRARAMTPGGDPRETYATLKAQWDDLKGRWGTYLFSTDRAGLGTGLRRLGSPPGSLWMPGV
jgi:tetratricopeptide (TPR) repeat protein